MSDLPKSWITAPLHRLGRWQGGGTPSKAVPEFWQGSIPWVSPKDMKAPVVRDSLDHISEAATQRSAATLIPERSILVVTRSGILAHSLPVAINAIEVTVNQDLKALTPSEGLSSDYLAYALKANERTILNDCVKDGTTVHSVEVPALLNFEIPIAPTREQDRIVAKIEELFSELDKAVESLTLARAQLKTYRQALLKAAFEGRLTADWRAANPDKLEPPETLLARIRTEREARHKQALAAWQTALAEWRAGGEAGRKPGKPQRPSEICASGRLVSGEPDGWAVVPLGLMIDEPAYGTAKKCGYETAGMGVLRIPNIGSGTVDPSDLKFASFDDDERETYRLLPGDLLTIRSNGSVSLVGKVALVTAAHTQYLYAGYLIRLRPNPTVVESAFLLRVMESHALRSQIESKAKSTSGVNNINSGELQELLVPVCRIEEQREVVERLEARLSAFDAVENEIDTAFDRISALRQSILKQAFSGQLVPQDPADEPASALLARLREEAPTARIRRRRTA